MSQFRSFIPIICRSLHSFLFSSASPKKFCHSSLPLFSSEANSSVGNWNSGCPWFGRTTANQKQTNRNRLCGNTRMSLNRCIKKHTKKQKRKYSNIQNLSQTFFQWYFCNVTSRLKYPIILTNMIAFDAFRILFVDSWR